MHYDMSTAKKEVKRITTKVLQSMKDNGEKIAMLTAYDYSSAKMLDEGGIDVLRDKLGYLHCEIVSFVLQKQSELNTTIGFSRLPKWRKNALLINDDIKS